jgi:3-dehydroquinate synthase
MIATLHRSVHVGGTHPYTIAIGADLLDDGIALVSRIRGRHVLIVSDENVAPLYARQLEISLHNVRPELRVARYIMPAGEQAKTLGHFAHAIDALATLGATRDACVLALGGGVVGDLAGFAAACWMRGIDCIQLPTTLLAMVDSSVGGKTAVDLPQGKNLVGAFHTPRAVFADISTLHSLPDRELHAGLAEVVKYGAITDAPFLDWLNTHRAALLAREHDALQEAITLSCRHKATIVEHDPFEHGERALLNFGHTFGHAIEAEQGYAGMGSDALNHGEAVAVGMVLAAKLSAYLGMAAAVDTQRLEYLLAAFGLPTALPADLDPNNLLERMRLDKKSQASGLRFVLWEAPGLARIVSDVPEEAVLETLRGG